MNFSNVTNSLGPVQHLREVSESGKELNFNIHAIVTIKAVVEATRRAWRVRNS